MGVEIGLKTVEKEKNWFQIAAICSSCLTSLSAGTLFSWTSPSIPQIVNDKITYDITLEEASYFTVIPALAMMFTCLFIVRLTDIIGRKYTLLLIGVPQLCAWILISLAKTTPVFYASRVLSGIADTLLFSALPTYVGEICTPQVRGTWGNILTFSIYLGQFLVNLVGSYASIQNTAFICMSIPVLFLCTFPFMPESPYYYMINGRIGDARVCLQKLRQRQNVEEELEKLKADVDRQLSETGTWADLFTIPSNRKAIYAGVFLRTSQQLAGISSFAVYTQYVFNKSGGDMSATASTLIFSGLTVVLNVAAAYTLDKFGRRKSYTLSLFLSGVVLLIEGIYFSIDTFMDVELKAVNWIPVAGMITYVFVYSFGLGIVPTLMLGELFSASVKIKGLTVLNFIFAILICVCTKMFQLLDVSFGLYAPFLLFSGSCFTCTILAIYFVPETKGKTLEEIQQSLKSKK